MARRRVLKGVLHNFLGTFASRSSELAGYWIFGMLFSSLTSRDINLLVPSSDDLEDALANLARERFRVQLLKQGLALSIVTFAQIEITKLPEPTRGLVGGLLVNGNDVMLRAHAVSEFDAQYAAELRIFVAPHDPRRERRSARAKAATSS